MTEVISSTLDQVKDLTVEHIGIERDKLTPESRFAEDMGCDSLDLIELTMAFEEKHNIEIADEETFEIKTVADAAALLDRKLAER